jgi:TPR repeat protein
LEIYHKEADQSINVDACTFLATVYEEGTLLPKNLAKSSAYYKKAVEGKNKYGIYRFAICLIKGTFNKNGQNVDDIKKALSLLNEISSGEDPCP